MQQYPLLQTKLYIPSIRSELVSRPRLLEQLNAGLNCKLTLISTPAGFGKTTLVSEWVSHFGLGVLDSGLGSLQERAIENPKSETGNRVAWLSLDEGDNDPTRFLAYLVAALQTIEARQGLAGNIGQGTLSALQSPQPPLDEAVLISLINEIAVLPDRIVLVLDDYHLIEAQPIQEALAFLLEHLPPQMHLVIASREDPPLPLARLRARGQLIELRATDLRFTSAEAAEFLNRVMGLGLAVEDIAALEARTEGWIAGLQLAAISMQGRKKNTAALIESFTGSHRFVLDYLVEEVLQQQPESVQDFLLRTAILDRLTGSLCDALTGHDDGQAILGMLQHTNLFIVSLDDERCWYRYHHLFADLLRQRLRQKRPDWIPTLHNQASEWYEQNGFVEQAIEHALRAEDFEQAACLIEEHVDALWMRGRQAKLRRWLAGLPDDLVFSKPHLGILHAWDLFARGQQDEAEKSLQAAEHALDTCSDLAIRTSPEGRDQPPDFERIKIRGRAATIRAFLAFYRGDVGEITKYAHQALEYLPEQDLTWRSTTIVALGDAYSFVGELEAAYRVRLQALEASRAAGNIYMILIAGMKLAVTMRQQGQLEQVIEICQQQLQLANERGLSQTAVVGWILAQWGEVLAELNDLDGAIIQAKKGTELAEGGRDVAMIGWSYLCLTRVLFSRGDMDGAEEIAQKMENIAREHYVPPWITSLMAARQARTWLAQDKLESVSQWVAERGLDADGDLTYLHEMEYIALARILVAQGRLDQAARLLQRLLEAAEAGGRTSRVLEILLLQALTFQAQGDTDRAITTLERALTLANPGGFIRIFVDEGLPMAHLLYAALSRGIAPDYVRRLLAAFPVAEPEQAKPSKSQAPESELIEPLSEREIEVLQLIAEGLTNREVAARLFLSQNTVKVHTRNIYGKLGAHSRTQAVARAQALGMLAST